MLSTRFIELCMQKWCPRQLFMNCFHSTVITALGFALGTKEFHLFYFRHVLKQLWPHDVLILQLYHCFRKNVNYLVTWLIKALHVHAIHTHQIATYPQKIERGSDYYAFHESVLMIQTRIQECDTLSIGWSWPKNSEPTYVVKENSLASVCSYTSIDSQAKRVVCSLPSQGQQLEKMVKNSIKARDVAVQEHYQIITMADTLSAEMRSELVSSFLRRLLLYQRLGVPIYTFSAKRRINHTQVTEDV